MIELAEAKPKIGATYISALRSQFGAAILEEVLAGCRSGDPDRGTELPA